MSGQRRGRPSSYTEAALGQVALLAWVVIESLSPGGTLIWDKLGAGVVVWSYLPYSKNLNVDYQVLIIPTSLEIHRYAILVEWKVVFS
jgi:hypothetical protein